LGHLAAEVLGVGRDAGIAVNHALSSTFRMSGGET
jgi:hypothetical protein